jgi:hypothetical protein
MASELLSLSEISGRGKSRAGAVMLDRFEAVLRCSKYKWEDLHETFVLIDIFRAHSK